MFKNILIVIRSTSKSNLLQIYDSSGQKIEEINVNNKYIFKGKINTLYKIRIISNDIVFNSNLYTYEKYDEPYIFVIKSNTYLHKIFIKLIDQNYNDLKIEKGRMKFWTTYII